MFISQQTDGNVEAAGYGRPKEGMLAEVRGERARIYEKQPLRNRVASSFPQAIEWKPFGLPEDFLPLLAGHVKRSFQVGKEPWHMAA